MIQKTQRTGFYIQITNFQLEKLENLCIKCEVSYNTGVLKEFEENFNMITKLVKEMQKGNSNAKETQ